jgi:hypothetical protein
MFAWFFLRCRALNQQQVLGYSPAVQVRFCRFLPANLIMGAIRARALRPTVVV